MRTLDDFRRRARGSLLGAAIGDAMGAPCEGMTRTAIGARYGVITGFLSDDAVGTDDTDFTLFNAWLLLEHGPDITPQIVAAEWRDKLLSGKYFYRPGGFSDVISTRNLLAGLNPPQSGAFNHQCWSDGVAMAISGAGILCAGQPQQAADLAGRLGSVSNARDGIATAQAVAAAISMAMVGAAPAEMMAAAQSVVPVGSWTGRTLARAAQIQADDLENALDAIDRHLVVHWWPWADLATEAVPVALAVFLAGGGDFARSVPAGIRMGRDADTIGAIVGSLAGACGGEDAIPPAWRERVAASTGKCIGFIAGRRITDIADALAQRAWEAVHG
ncbi:MAG: ADP-ribosylglycohydrolase family protein [Anaerolineae bacterium]|nr:ADP-ribosylglycohydrolase family protein [Anaerolineae bacterium]